MMTKNHFLSFTSSDDDDYNPITASVDPEYLTTVESYMDPWINDDDH